MPSSVWGIIGSEKTAYMPALTRQYRRVPMTILPGASVRQYARGPRVPLVGAAARALRGATRLALGPRIYGLRHSFHHTQHAHTCTHTHTRITCGRATQAVSSSLLLLLVAGASSLHGIFSLSLNCDALDGIAMSFAEAVGRHAVAAPAAPEPHSGDESRHAAVAQTICQTCS